MGRADRICELRTRLGKSELEMSKLLGINIHWYHALELHDDELESTLSLKKVKHLATLLGVKMGDLIGVSGEATGVIPLEQLPHRIYSCAKSESLSLQQFEDHVGWRLTAFLDDPVEIGLGLPIIFFQDLAAVLGVPWISLLPYDD